MSGPAFCIMLAVFDAASAAVLVLGSVFVKEETRAARRVMIPQVVLMALSSVALMQLAWSAPR